MNAEEVLREQAGEQQPPYAEFAEVVLAVRRRRRAWRIAAAAIATAVVAAAALSVPRLAPNNHSLESAGRAHSDLTLAHPKQSMPRNLIAAGSAAMAAYYTQETVWQSPHHGTSVGTCVRTYRLLNPKSGRYEKTTRWSWVAVAPGLRTAAVLEQHLPVRRIGIFDFTSGKVERWIPVAHPVGGLAFSHDGTKIVATTYAQNPDLQERASGSEEVPTRLRPSRTGFYVLDARSGQGSWARVGTTGDDELGNMRQDFALARDGRTVWAGAVSAPSIHFYDTRGNKTAAPTGERYLAWFIQAGLSPDGTNLAGDFAGHKWHTSSWLIDPATGRQKAEVHGQELLAWADNKSLIAWDIGKSDKGEFHSRLVLVTIGSAREIPLSGFQQGNDVSPDRWWPIFAER